MSATIEPEEVAMVLERASVDAAEYGDSAHNIDHAKRVVRLCYDFDSKRMKFAEVLAYALSEREHYADLASRCLNAEQQKGFESRHALADEWLKHLTFIITGERL